MLHVLLTHQEIYPESDATGKAMVVIKPYRVYPLGRLNVSYLQYNVKNGAMNYQWLNVALEERSTKYIIIHFLNVVNRFRQNTDIRF